MRKLCKLMAAFILCFALVFGAAACSSDVKVSLSDDGYLIVNGEKTDVKIGEDGENGVNGSNGKSAYEIYKDANPDYKGSEAQWMKDMAAGVLAEKHEYDTVSYGKHCDGLAVSGTVSVGAAVNFKDAVVNLNNPVILPLSEKSEWKMNMLGTLTPSGAGGGQILTSFADGTEGRIYIGINIGNNVLFWGVCIDGMYANYCFDVPAATMREEHEYEFSYNGEEFLLSIDSEAPLHLSKININQNNATQGEGLLLSAELAGKMRAATGQNFAVLRHIGANTHKVTAQFKYIKTVTSSIYGYGKLKAHPLADKTVYYLGSSVTRGHGGDTDGVSFAEKTAALTGGKYVKETISGTNLAVTGGRTDSYVERLSKLDLTKSPDVLVLQLSSNDFSNNITWGEVSKGIAGFDKTTVTGAIEEIAATVYKASPSTRVVLYTCPLTSKYGARERYGEYVRDYVPALARKWSNLEVLDLFNADYVKVGAYLQGDGLHPQKMGYAHLFTPALVNLLLDVL